MTKPSVYLIRMVLFLVAVAALLSPLHEELLIAFLANAPLNGAILAVLVLGIFYTFRQVIRLYPEVRWVEGFRRSGPVISEPSQPQLLAPMATMMAGKNKRDSLSLSTTSMRTLLDSIMSRLDESRDISRYVIGLLIFLGLLGTFWGLLETLGSVRDVITGLSVTGENGSQVFEELKAGLERPLAGMGTAFSSSLFGLAGSLILGFLELQASQAQNRFTTELEEWLSSLTKLSSGALAGDGEHSVSAYVQALLEQTAESLDSLQRIISRGEESRINANTQMAQLMEKIDLLTDQMRGQQDAMQSMANAEGGLDRVTKDSIKSLDRHVSHMTQDIAQGRDQVIKEVRAEIKLLARTIAALAEGDGSR